VAVTIRDAGHGVLTHVLEIPPSIARYLRSENVDFINDHVTRRKQRVAVQMGVLTGVQRRDSRGSDRAHEKAQRGVYAPVNKGAVDLGPLLHHAEVVFAGVLGLPPRIAHPRRLLG
jgi:hypothetical protein